MDKRLTKGRKLIKENAGQNYKKGLSSSSVEFSKHSPLKYFIAFLMYEAIKQFKFYES